VTLGPPRVAAAEISSHRLKYLIPRPEAKNPGELIRLVDSPAQAAGPTN